MRVPHAIDAKHSKIIWRDPLPQGTFDLTKPIRITSVEFDVSVYDGGQLLQRFAALSPNPSHGAFIGSTLSSACRALDFSPQVLVNGNVADAKLQTAFLSGADWQDETNWPPEGDYVLSGGIDVLDKVTIADWHRTFEILPRIADAALLAAPDIVLPDAELPAIENIQGHGDNCSDLSPVEPGYFRGRVTSINTDGSETAISGVIVDVKGKGNTATTDEHGIFLVTDTGSSLVTLRLSKPGFETLDFKCSRFPIRQSRRLG